MRKASQYSHRNQPSRKRALPERLTALFQATGLLLFELFWFCIVA